MRRFGELEQQIMDTAWAADRPLTVRQMLQCVDRDPPPAYTTVMTVMDNLHRKGFLVRCRQGRAWSYRPAESRADHDARLMAEVLGSSADPAATLLRFVGRMSPEELNRLRALMPEPPGGGR
ncbi:putative transcriptional regulator [Stackebrandtia albiflava]|uniref:Putative transcriptional regulator n=1 Tax=Stackebrandtia albiflava TaxID=406432 RepID=A0A562V1Z9_9ACTN|nr:BlaI/MecI/CopY family transcriptional regulator [Stackebrandtia albiflava]TWJ11881.1 putative transcriptional regulator [Stackebrandtia albiflava]